MRKKSVKKSSELDSYQRIALNPRKKIEFI